MSVTVTHALMVLYVWIVSIDISVDALLVGKVLLVNKVIKRYKNKYYTLFI